MLPPLPTLESSSAEAHLSSFCGVHPPRAAPSACPSALYLIPSLSRRAASHETAYSYSFCCLVLAITSCRPGPCLQLGLVSPLPPPLPLLLPALLSHPVIILLLPPVLILPVLLSWLGWRPSLVLGPVYSPVALLSPRLA